MHKYLTTILISLFIHTAVYSQDFIKPTQYDWNQVAKKITGNCNNDYDRAKAIYSWITANISYDTSYSIYHAEECWEQKRGVCQAYCELFYHIAGALGIRIDIISGTSKDTDRKQGRHAWLYVETDKNLHQGILVDPTWGAGTVKDGVFTRKNNDMSWFHINPYMLIFTHYPDSTEYQFMEEPITFGEFSTLPPLYPSLEQLGLNGKQLYVHCSKNPENIPELYHNNEPPFYIEEIPMQKTVRTGSTYHFALRKCSMDFSLICGKEFVKSTEWKYSNGVYTLDYTVPCGEELSISYHNKKDNLYYTVVSYEIPEANVEDLENLERKRIYSMPEIVRLMGNRTNSYKKKGFDGKKILEGIRENKITTLPETYDNNAITVVDVPLDGVLKSGRKYIFRIRSNSNGKPAIINNKEWYKDWTIVDQEGVMEIEVYPNPGTLVIAIQEGSGKSYSYCIKYKVR